MTRSPVERARRAALAGVVGPVAFLSIAFAMALARPELIRAQGWKSWPSVMATGGPPGALPQIGAFAWLACCYVVFSLGAIRPVLRAPVVTASFLAIATGDLLLVFPTDVPNVQATWHGSLHLAGVIVATVATVIGTVASLIHLRGRAGWTGWRWATVVIFVGTLAGLLGGFSNGLAKVIYVVAITAPVPVLALTIRRHAEEALGSVPA